MTIQQTNKQYDKHVREYYHKLNCEEIQSRTRDDLNYLIERLHNQYEYCPYRFKEQFTWVKNRFYYTKGKGEKPALFAVKRETDEPPIAIHQPLLHDMF